MRNRLIQTIFHSLSLFKQTFIPVYNNSVRPFSTINKAITSSHSSIDIAIFEEQQVQTNHLSKYLIINMSSETTSPVIIDGKATADAIRLGLKEKVTSLSTKYGRVSIIYCISFFFFWSDTARNV